MSSIRALITDLDGVVRIWSAEHTSHVEHEHGLPAGTIESIAFEPALLDQALCGKITDAAWREVIAIRLAELFGVQGSVAMERWSSFRGVVDSEMLNVVRAVRKLMPVVLLTNQSTRLSVDLDVLGITDAFSAIINSAQLGVAKPARQAFEAAVRLTGVSAEDCGLVDDRAVNVAVARSLGMKTVLHRSAAETRRALRTMGLPIAIE